MQQLLKEGTRRGIAVLRSGMLGEVHEIHAWSDRPIWPQGVARPKEKEAPPQTFAWDLWLGPAKERPYHSTYHPLRWRGWREFGSGALGDFGPHLLGGVFWGLDLVAPLAIEPLHITSAGDARETFPPGETIAFTFAGERKLTWYDGGSLPPKDVTSVDRPPPNGVMVIGEHGKLFLPDYGRAPKLIGFKEKVALPPPADLPEDIHRDWIEACKSGGKTVLPFSAAEGLMRTCVFGNLAVAAERKLTADEATQHASRDYRTGWSLPRGKFNGAPSK
jgi:predicted dehydrogenase